MRGRKFITRRVNNFDKKKIKKYFDQFRWKTTNSRKAWAGEKAKSGRKGQIGGKMNSHKKRIFAN